MRGTVRLQDASVRAKRHARQVLIQGSLEYWEENMPVPALEFGHAAG